MQEQRSDDRSMRSPGRSYRATSRKIRLAVLVILGTPIFLYTWLICFTHRLSTAYVSPLLLDARRILWVTAHPDDESMFFAPSIFNLLSSHHKSDGTEFNPIGHILSLSSGNNDGLGARRTVEMRAACWALGVISEHCIVLDVDTLPDSMSLWWEERVIESWVRAYMQKWNIDTIITFDEEGISGHANHRAIHAALLKAVNVDLDFPPVFTLRTTRSFIAKYTSLFMYPYLRALHRWRLGHPLPEITWEADEHPIGHQKYEFLQTRPDFSQEQKQSGYLHPFSSHPSLLVNSPWQYLKTRTAFKQHKSQVVWFRKLYMMLSRYMWFNELEKIGRVHERVIDLRRVRENAQKDAL